MQKTLKSEKVYDGKVITVYRNEIDFNGISAIRDVVTHNGGAAVICERDGAFLFVTQYRYPMKEEMIEIPAGKRDGNEDPFETARRELGEEGNLIPLNLRRMCSFAVSPGYTTEIIHLYYADEFVATKGRLDDDEELTCKWIKKDEAYEMAKNGLITDGKTLLAMTWYKTYIQRVDEKTDNQ